MTVGALLMNSKNIAILITFVLATILTTIGFAVSFGAGAGFITLGTWFFIFCMLLTVDTSESKK